MTITSPEIIATMLENDGRYPGDPQAYAIYSYVGQGGATCWKVCMDPSSEREFYSSPFCADRILLWAQYLSGTTVAGTRFLKQYKSGAKL